MDSIPLNVPEPLVRFDIFGIIGVDISSGIVLVAGAKIINLIA